MRAPRIVALLVVVGGLAASPAHADGETCRGQAATIVGTPETEHLSGTDGDDVIVTNGAWTTTAGDGSDTICVTGHDAYLVDAGDGDDVVDTTASYRLKDEARVVLGAGADTFLGGNGRDSVTTGTETGLDTRAVDADVDRVETGRGHDTVFTGQRLVTNHDDVDLGGGNDHLYPRSDHNDGDLDGGAAKNDLTLALSAGTWVVDEQVDQLRQGGAVVTQWTALTATRIDDGGVDADVTYIGSSGDDVVDISADLHAADLGSGDDVIGMTLRSTSPGRLDGGPGHDYVHVFGDASVQLDLRRHRLARWREGDGYRVAGFEYHRADAQHVRMIGGPDDDEFGYDGCTVRVRGNEGDDLLHWSYDGAACGRRTDMRVLGGRGDDRLLGGWYHDHLDGGRGYDVVRGGGDVDWCAGEERRGCELP